MGGTVMDAAVVELELQSLTDALLRAESLIDKNLLSAMKLVGTKVANRAKEVHGYTDRTGLLTQSIRPGIATGSFLEGTLQMDVIAGGIMGVHYGRYIEEGTKRGIKPFRFMANAAEFVASDPGTIEELEEVLVDAIEESMKGGG